MGSLNMMLPSSPSTRCCHVVSQHDIHKGHSHEWKEQLMWRDLLQVLILLTRTPTLSNWPLRVLTHPNSKGMLLLVPFFTDPLQPLCNSTNYATRHHSLLFKGWSSTYTKLTPTKETCHDLLLAHTMNFKVSLKVPCLVCLLIPSICSTRPCSPRAPN